MTEETPAPTEAEEANRREIARWSVGKTMEEIVMMAKAINEKPASIYEWRNRYAGDLNVVVDEVAPLPTPEEAEQIRETVKGAPPVTWAHGSRGTDWTKEANGMGKEEMTEAKKIEIAKWSVGKSEKEILAKAKTIGYSAAATIYQWRKQFIGRGPTKRQWTEKDKRRLVTEYETLGRSEEKFKQAHPEVAPSMVRRWGAEFSKQRGGARFAFTPDLRDKAIALAQRIGATEAASRLGLKRSTVSTWLERASKDEQAEQEANAQMTVKPSGQLEKAIQRTDSDELRKLRLENTILHAILADAKAQGYVVPEFAPLVPK